MSRHFGQIEAKILLDLALKVKPRFGNEIYRKYCSVSSTKGTQIIKRI